MPNLLLFVPCEKAIVDTNGSLSLISVMGKLTLKVPSNAPPLPPNAMLPMQWAIVSIWQQSSDWESGRTFEQRAALVSEAGDILVESLVAFKFTKDQLHQVIANESGMPIGSLGALKVKVWIRDKADPPKEWKEVASFPLTLEVQPVPPPTVLN
jgi:hypothetical protein